MEEKKFNIRVYGLLINEQQEVLLSNEQKGDFKFTKFPGGGLEWGEGIIECLKREFKEELNIEIEPLQHFYTTDFFQVSAFAEEDQLISIYYKVGMTTPSAIQNGFEGLDEAFHSFEWHPIKELSMEQLTFPIDQKVASLLQKSIDQSILH